MWAGQDGHWNNSVSLELDLWPKECLCKMNEKSRWMPQQVPTFTFDLLLFFLKHSRRRRRSVCCLVPWRPKVWSQKRQRVPMTSQSVKPEETACAHEYLPYPCWTTGRLLGNSSINSPRGNGHMHKIKKKIVVSGNPCGGGLEYLHRTPASR
jgi:hypothetical protein